MVLTCDWRLCPAVELTSAQGKRNSPTLVASTLEARILVSTVEIFSLSLRIAQLLNPAYY